MNHTDHTPNLPRHYDILRDSWDTTQDHIPHSIPVKPTEHIPIKTTPHIHRKHTAQYVDGGSICADTDKVNKSRPTTLQHRLGSIPVRLQRHNRNGANYHISIIRMSNRDRRRMTEYNARKQREVQGTSLV